MQRFEAQEDGQPLHQNKYTEATKSSSDDDNGVSQPSHTGQLTPPEENRIPSVDRPADKMGRTSTDRKTKVQNESLKSSTVSLESTNIDEAGMVPKIPIVLKSEIDGIIETPKDAPDATVPEQSPEDERQARIDQFNENVSWREIAETYDDIWYNFRRRRGSKLNPIDGLVFYADHVQRAIDSLRDEFVTSGQHHKTGQTDEDPSDSEAEEKANNEGGEAVEEREKPMPRRMNLKTYQLSAGHTELNGHVLDVLSEEPVFEKPIKPWSRMLKPMITNTPVHDRRGPLDTIPERFRMFSVPVIKIMRLLMPKTTSTALDGLEAFTYHRPYRTLIRIEPFLRSYMEQLEDLHKPRLETGQQELLSNRPSRDDPMNVPDNNKEQQILPIKEEEGSEVDETEEVLRSKDTLEDLQCLISFIDEDLGKLLQLRKLIANREAQEISFNNVWLLFQLGDEVVSPQIPSQIFKVFHTTGGRQIEKPRTDDRIIIRRRERERERDLIIDEDESTTAYRRHEKFTPFIVHAYRLDYDGDRIIPVEHKFRISNYEDVRPITSLDVFPIGFQKESKRLRQGFVTRGQSFVELAQASSSHKEYKGLSLDEASEEINGSVMIDFSLAFKDDQLRRPSRNLQTPDQDPREMQICDGGDHEESECQICEHHWPQPFPDRTIDHKRSLDFINELLESLDKIEDKENLGGHHLCLLPPTVWAFVFRSRRWRQLDILRLKPVTRGDDGFDSLVLPRGYKDLVKALVKNHFQMSEGGSANDVHDFDLVKGKGKGLVMLLHGAPGVGKTATAECVAALSRRPLFPITCGDLGTSPREVEESLTENFRMAHRWNCVLLLDEADVFLQARSLSDINRNGLVSVFLRVLEYYRGILFLTTNRIAAFDEAFKSRIHIQLLYPKLLPTPSRKIWKKNLEKLENGKGDFKFDLEIDKDEILKFAEDEYNNLKWNGRQIRNAVQTAMALAEYDACPDQSQGTFDQNPHDLSSRERRKVRLTMNDFKRVAKASCGFDEYLRSLRGHNDSEEAKGKGLRNDTWGLPKDQSKHPQPALQPPEEVEYSEDENLVDALKIEEEQKRVEMQKKKKEERQKKKQAEQAKQDELKRQVAEHETKKKVKEEKKRRKLEAKRAKDGDASSDVSSDEDDD